MLEAYTANFTALTPADALYLSIAVAARHESFVSEAGGEYESGEDLFNQCENCDLDQADVVMSLANDPSPLAVTIIEKLIGRPITREIAKELRAAATAPRTPRPQVKKTDPRKIATVADNPKRAGSASHARYELYTVGDTVSEAIAKGLTAGDIKHDSGKGFITMEELS
tara:strand:- start:308 stop:814 length:507 start_codon:yes stop_codon:yes gene_type:complete